MFLCVEESVAPIKGNIFSVFLAKKSIKSCIHERQPSLFLLKHKLERRSEETSFEDSSGYMNGQIVCFV